MTGAASTAQATAKPFAVDLSAWFRATFDRAALEAAASWKDFGNGSRIGKLAREGNVGLVVYHIADGAKDDVFGAHTHVGGEMYYVLQGETYDDDGTYPAGTLVWMRPGSRHLPKTRGETWILVLWPDGVRA
ncbi:MAG TPA: cupin domain-containing protein [Candidatus Thermoplasmatota archaeon]|nr:cupin domain-containing protein [Candidatus Thermoplasmatota archaeon]